MDIGTELYRPRLAEQWPDARAVTLAQHWADASLVLFTIY